MTDQPTIVLHLPVPPSANRLWRVVPGRRKPVLDAAYARWILDAGWEAKMQLGSRSAILGSFDARIEVPVMSRKDADNFAKPLLDLCQRVGAINNDSGLLHYEVTKTDRTDCMIALWDRGGAIRKAAHSRVPYAAPKRPSPARIARAERARRLP